MAKWHPGKVIEPFARALQHRASRAIRSAAPHVPHKDAGGAVGGTLARAVLAKDLVRVKAWGAIIRWSSLGQVFLFFVEGTTKQKPRPVPLRPDIPKMVAALQKSAAAHFKAKLAGKAQRVSAARRRR